MWRKLRVGITGVGGISEDMKSMIMRQWLDAITKDAPTRITVEDGRNLTEIIEACTIASREGRTVELPL